MIGFLAAENLAILSRIQFAFTVGFHIIWPTITIGLGLFLLVMEGMWLKTGADPYIKLYKFWAKIYALAFAIGVVTGVPLAYQFGTNFANLSYIGGSVLGPLMGVEVMTAFFLEAAFIGVMLFGWGKIPNYLHFLATLCVVLGTHNSTFWIIAANSWMHTPQGFVFEDGRMVVTSWLQVIFTPSFPYRFFHMLFASYVSAGLLILGVSSWFLLKKQGIHIAKTGIKIAVIVIAILTPLQIVLGDLSGLNVLEYQPAKIAAIEGLWQTKAGAPLVLFGLPNTQTKQNDYAIEIPKLSSLILTHKLNGEIKGINEFESLGHPYVPIVFFSFRIMVGCGVLILLLSLIGLYYVLYKKLENVSQWFLKYALFCSPLGIIAVITGWITAECGRQPWVVYNYLRTKDALSNVIPEAVFFSLIGFIIVYTLLMLAFLYYSKKLIKKGPEGIDVKESWLEVISHTSHVTNK